MAEGGFLEVSLKGFVSFLHDEFLAPCLVPITLKGPFTLAIFAAILAAIFAAISSVISRRFQIARVNYWRFKSPRNRQ